jgi:prophage regulatory protein
MPLNDLNTRTPSSTEPRSETDDNCARPSILAASSLPPVGARHNDGDRFIGMAELIVITGLSRATIYRRIKNGHFIRSVKISARRVAWRASDVNRWLAMPHPADYAAA